MALGLIIALIVLVLLTVPVGAIVVVMGMMLAEVSGRSRFIGVIGEIFWEQGNGFILLSVPLFILLGEIMLRSGIATRMYSAVAKWTSWLPGGLMHANIGASALFAATSGSSVATVATIGTVAYPEIKKRGYHEGIFLGSLAAGGTLGILIPPSVAMIIYGVMTNTSVPDLYLAGIIPGIVLALMFSIMILGLCLLRPSWGGEQVSASWGARLRALVDLAPPMAVFGAVVGSIYTGLATPTEAASLGVCVALGLAALFRTLTLKMLLLAFERTMLTSAMILFIVYASLFFNFILGFSGITQQLLSGFSKLALSPALTLTVLVIFYLVLGMFVETLSMILLTLPIVFPIVMNLHVPGYSDVWFGIIIVILMEMALITPPVGLNLFVAQGIRTGGGSFSDIALGSLPFVIPMLGLVFILMLFPQLAIWLPDLVKARPG